MKILTHSKNILLKKISLFSIIVLFISSIAFQSCKTTTSEVNTNETKTVVEPVISQTAPLNYLVREGKNKNSKVLLLMHGLGSDENDLFSFSNFIDDSWTVFSLRAPLKHTNGKYAWYSMNLKNGARDRNFDDIENSGKKLKEFLSYAKEKYNFNEDEVYIGGFSQGSIMSLYFGLYFPELISGMACFSGLLLDDIQLSKIDKEKAKELNIFMSHGKLDKIVPIDEARKAKAFLEKQNIPIIYKEYAEKHTISRQNLTDFLTWVKSL